LGAAPTFAAPKGTEALAGSAVALCLLVGAFLLGAATICALRSLSPTDLVAPPSALVAVRYWREDGDLRAVESVIEGMEEAQRALAHATERKLRLLKTACIPVVLGLSFVASLAIVAFRSAPGAH